MEAVILPKEQFDELLQRMDKIQTALVEKQKEPRTFFSTIRNFYK